MLTSRLFSDLTVAEALCAGDQMPGHSAGLATSVEPNAKHVVVEIFSMTSLHLPLVSDEP